LVKLVAPLTVPPVKLDAGTTSKLTVVALLVKVTVPPVDVNDLNCKSAATFCANKPVPEPKLDAVLISPPLPDNKFVLTPAPAAVKSIYTPLAVPPCSKNLSLFCQTSIVTPPTSVVFAAALLRNISPPSSPVELYDLK